MSTLGNKMAQQWDNRYTIHCKEIGPENHEWYTKQWNGSVQIFNNYWMRFIVMFRIIKVEVGVISWGRCSPSRVLMLACRNSGDLGSSWNYTITCNLHLFCGANVGSLGHFKLLTMKFAFLYLKGNIFTCFLVIIYSPNPLTPCSTVDTICRIWRRVSTMCSCSDLRDRDIAHLLYIETF